MKKIIDLPDIIFIGFLFLGLFLLTDNNVKLFYILLLLVFVLIGLLAVSYLHTLKKDNRKKWK